MYEVELPGDRKGDPTLKHYFATIACFDLLTADEEAALALRIRQGDQAALDRLVNANLRFVANLAKRFLGRGLSYMDLIAEGNIGLIIAAKRFDENRDARFITYAAWWILQSIQGALQDNIRTVRLPANRARQAQRIVRAKRKLAQSKMGMVLDEDLAAEIDVKPGIVARIRAACRTNLAFDQPLGGQERTLEETLSDPHWESPLIHSERESLEEVLAQAMSRLSHRERDVIENYYGLGSRPPVSLEAIGARISLSRERVRQIRNRAFAKLRMGHRGRKLAEFL